jgi:hypothetical protein
MNKNIQHIEEMIQLGEEVQHLEEKNCPTNPSKWSYYKSQAKQKFDVYPSAYANGWASKQYKAAGGGWKQCAGESVNEGPIDRIIGGRPYEYIGDGRKGKAVVSGPMKDNQKADIIKRAKKAGYTAKPNMGGGVTIFIESVNENKVDKLRNAVQKINRKYQVKVSTHPVTKGEVEIILGRGNHPDSVYHSIEKLVSKLGFKRGQYSIFDESVNEAYVIFYAKKKGDKPSQAAYRDKDMALKFEKDLKKDGYITMVTQKKIKGVDESVNEASVGDFEIGDFVHFKSKNKTGMVLSIKGNKVTINTPKGKVTGDIKDVQVLYQDNVNNSVKEDENDPQEIKVGNYQTKYFHVCPGASTLYKDIESKGVDMDMAERSVRLQDALFFIEEHIQRDGYDPEKDYVMVAKNIAKNIMKLAKMMGLEEEHNYIQGHIDTIEKVANGGSVNEGNAFTGALFKARKEGLTEFEFNGKKYPVHKLEEEEVIEEGVQSKHKLVKEGVMSNIDMLAGESDTFMDFMKTFKKEYPEFDYKNRDLVKWLQSTYKSKRG